MKKLYLKKIISILCIFVLLIGAVSVTANGATGDTKSFSLENWTALDKEKLDTSISTKQAYDGNSSVYCKRSASATGTNAYFLVANSSSDYCKIERNKKYILTFNYYVETAQSKDFDVNIIYSKKGSRYYNPKSNANKFTIPASAATGTWLNAAVVLDTSVIEVSTAVAIYFSLSDFTSAAVYFDNISVTELAGTENITVINNFGNDATPYYASGDVGTSINVSGAADGIYKLDGVYSDLALTTATTATIASGFNSIYLKLTRVTFDINMESFYNDAQMEAFQDYPGMDQDFELYTEDEGEETSVTTNCETFSYATGTYTPTNVFRSADVHTSGSYSVCVNNGGFFPVGNGTNIFTVNQGGIYKLSFKYYVGSNSTNLNVGVNFGTVSHTDVTVNEDKFIVPQSTPSAWNYGEVYINPNVIQKSNANSVYITVSGTGNIYFDDITLTRVAENSDNVVSGGTSLHRKGEKYYTGNATINTATTALELNAYYELKFWVKCDKYAQTNGAIGILRTSTPNYAFAAVSGYNGSTNIPGDYETDVIYTTPITSLTDGGWHAVTMVFKATGEYIALTTPGYVSLYFDDFKIIKLNKSIADTTDVSFTAYTQKKVENPVYTTANKTNAVTSFENYPYELPQGYSNVYDASSGALGLKYTSDAANEYVRLTAVDNRTFYKITFNYKSSDTATLNFITYDGDNGLVTDYAQFGGKADIAESSTWQTETVYLSTYFASNVKKNAFANDKTKRTTEYGNILGFYINGEGDVTVDNFSITTVTNPLGVTGMSVLNTAAESVANAQAMRFYYNYKGASSTKITVNGTDYDVTERGMFIRDCRIYAYANDGENYFVPSVYNCKTKLSKTENLEDVWSFSNGKTTFSNYVTGLSKTDAREIEEVGYVKFTVNGNTYTVLSSTLSSSVAEQKEKNGLVNSTETTHTIAGNGTFYYQIVLPQSRSYFVTMASEEIVAAYNKLGVSFNTVTDQTAATNYEILIGSTSRSESKTSNYNLGTNEYIVTVKNGKLVINGTSDLSIYAAAKKLAEYLDKCYKYGAISTFAEGDVIVKGTYNENTGDYKLSFADEFNGSTINTKIWQNVNGECFAYKNQHKSSLGVFNFVSPLDKDDERFTLVGCDTGATAKVFEESNGCMTISTARVKEGDEYIFYGGQASTIKTMNYKYGILEIRAKIADRPGFTSLWVNGDTSGIRTKHPETGRTAFVEYDLIESKGATNMVTANIHKWWSKGDYTHNTIQYTSTDGLINTSRSAGGSTAKKIANYIGSGCTLHDSYHVYTFVWTEDKVIYALDGTPFCTVDLTQYKGDGLFDLSGYINLANHMGEDWGGYYIQGSTPDLVTTSIDYLRVYQSNTDNSLIRFYE